MLNLLNAIQSNGTAAPLKIDRNHVRILAKNQLVQTKVQQTFTNPNSFDVECVYIFPVTDDMAPSNISLSVDGKQVTGELHSERDSRRIYRDSARLAKNSAILEHLGKRAFVAEVPNVMANAVCQVEFKYSQVVHVENDSVKYTYPLSLTKSATGLIADLAVEMEIESDDELGAIIIPSHDAEINQEDDHHARISFVATDVDPDDDFLCSYSVSNETFGINLLTHRADENQDGYFMLNITPKYTVEKTEVLKKDFIFVLDRSGSMAGRKVEQAKDALRYCIQNLNEGDRFNLILFNTQISSLTDRLNKRQEWIGGERTIEPEASYMSLLDVDEGRERAYAFIDGIEGRGGTNINDALLTALAGTPDPERPRIIVFLTDGRPTAGVRHPTDILRNVAEANNKQSRIFVFGVGRGVNNQLLDKMAADNGGTPNYVKPEEDIEDAVSTLFRQMNDPVLVNLELNFGEIITNRLAPDKFPDLFRGEQLMLYGRYEAGGKTDLKLRGKIRSEQQEFSKKVHFSKLEEDNDFLPHLWAQRRLVELVDKAALYGESEELQKEIEHLCNKYDVETPDTIQSLARDGSLRTELAYNVRDAYSPNKTNAEAFDRSKEITRLKSVRHREQRIDKKVIGHKTFRRIRGLWVDTRYDGNSALKEILFDSQEYIDLAEESVEIARCLKLYESMIICHDGVNYKITN